MATWISVDWDYVTGDRAAGPLRCCARQCYRHVGLIGRGRMPRFVLRGTWQPGRQLLGLYRLVRRVTISRAVFRDSHASLSRLLHRGDEVYHLDYHEDRYEAEDGKAFYNRLYCGNWVTQVEKRGVIVHDMMGFERGIPDGEYRLFVCWSRPYTHKAADGALLRFLGSLKCRVDFRADH